VSDSSTYSKYSVKVKLTARGSWRVRAYFADTAHRAGYSAYRRLKVK